MKLCPNGHENPDDADFCVECGESLRFDETSIWRVPTIQPSGETEGAAASAPPPPPAPAQPAPAAVRSDDVPLSQLSGREQLARLFGRKQKG